MGEAQPTEGKELNMALTRKMLEAMGIDAEKIESIIEAHSESVNAIKAERDNWKAKAESVDTTEDWKAKYEKEHSDYEAFKTNQQKRETRTAKETALREVYKEAGIAEKYIPALLRIADYDKVELDKDGKARDHARLVETAKSENADFIPVTTVKGAETATPPAGDKVRMTKDQIFAITDPAARQKAIAENLDVFGY